jgi:nucleoside phosphorylase
MYLKQTRTVGYEISPLRFPSENYKKSPRGEYFHNSVLVSADSDLVPSEISQLNIGYTAIAGDRESGAIAYVCLRNNKKLLILRGVSDLIMSKLLDQLLLLIDFNDSNRN